jgi:hypothetical protein
MRLKVVMLVLPALAGCTSNMPNMSSPVENQGRMARAQSMYNSQDDNECRFRGVTVGTDPYIECRKELARAHLEEEAARQAERIEAERRAAAGATTPLPQR